MSRARSIAARNIPGSPSWAALNARWIRSSFSSPAVVIRPERHALDRARHNPWCLVEQPNHLG
ncbi:MAG: hypothetical protein U0074_24470 [Kouleothrix sp.]